MLLWRGSKFNGENQNRDEEDTSGAATAPYEVITSEDGAEVRLETPQDDGSEGRDFTKNCSNQKVEYAIDNVVTDAKEIGSLKYQYKEFTHDGASSDLKSEDNLLQEQLYVNVSETADLASEKKLSSENEYQVSSKANPRNSADIEIVLEEPEEVLVTSDDKSRDQVRKQYSMHATAVMATEEAVLEFDRLWQGAINSKEVVVLDKSEADLDSVLKKFKSNNSDNQDWDSTLSSWEEKASETDEGNDEDQSTLGMWRQTRFSSGRDEDEYEEDGVQPEEISNAEELLPPSLTDITIPQDELERLCALRLTIRGWMTIGTEGVKRGIVKSIHSKWLVSEIAKVRCIVPGRNMREFHDDLEVSNYLFTLFTCLFKESNLTGGVI